MSDAAWKQLERQAAALFGARRFPANSGARADFEAPLEWVGQVKLVKRMSLEELTALVEQTEALALDRGAQGVVVCKVRRGAGRPSPLLVVMSADTWGRVVVAPPHRLVTLAEADALKAKADGGD